MCFSFKTAIILGVVFITVWGQSSWSNSWTGGKIFPGSKFQVTFSKLQIFEEWFMSSFKLGNSSWTSMKQVFKKCCSGRDFKQCFLCWVCFSLRSDEVTASWWSLQYIFHLAFLQKDFLIYFGHFTFSSWYGNLFSRCLLLTAKGVACAGLCLYRALWDFFSAVICSTNPF